MGQERRPERARDRTSTAPPPGGDEARALLPRLLAELGERRARIAAAGPDLERVAAEAHRLSGAAAYCGAPELGAVASRLEDAARSGDGARTARLLRDLDGVIERLRREASPGA